MDQIVVVVVVVAIVVEVTGAGSTVAVTCFVSKKCAAHPQLKTLRGFNVT
jgi:hypothetical protein